ncbi:MAG: fibronectin type III domain-containing protein [Propionibacteriaceae bacterium]|nr:fibronectin type III domain-containing protein [Propionibacteriaceae bacterium]
MVVYGRPEAPSAPVPGPVVLSHGVGLVWSSGADHGASVEEFELVEVGSGKSWSVGRATRFDVVGLSNGVEVCFQVRARNRAGWSDFSLVGPCQVPNEAPGRAAGFQVSGVGDGALSLVWDPAPVDGTPVTGYRLVWPGGVIDDLDGSARQATVTGLDNYTIYDFTLTARNVMGWSEQVALTSGQPSGRPTGLTGVTVSPSSLGGQVELALTWPVALPNGPGPVTYMVTRSGGPQGTVSFGPLSSTSLVDRVDYDGSDLVYEITATNASGGPEHTAGPVRTDFHAVSPPDPWLAGSLTVVPTGQSGQAKLTLVVPPSHGGASQLTLIQGPGGSLVSPGPNGGTVERVVSGFTDGYDTAVQVKLCNEDGQCQISSIVYVSTFGQLVTPVVTAWPHGSYGDHQVCAQANAEAMGAGASLVLRSSNGYVSEPRTGPNALFSGDFCVDAGGQEITITFTATLTSDPTNPTRPNPTPGTAQATTPKDPKPPLEKPVLEVILGGLGDHLVCATAHGDGRGYPASLYVSNSFDSTRSATVSGDNALNTTKLCVDPGGPGVQVTFTAHLSTGVTDPPRANAPDVTITATSSANPLLTPTIQANTPGTTGDYRVCASAQGNGQGTPAKLYITSSNGQTSTTDSGSGALSVSNWCITVDPSQTITFTAHLDNDFSAAPRDNKTATASATAPNPPPAFATPGIVARADSGYSGYGVCFNASGQAAGYPAQLKVTVNLSGAGPWQTSYGTGYLGLNEICFDTGKPSTTFTFTVTLTSQAGDRADATNTAMIKTLPAPSITVYKGAKATVDSYYIGIYTHDFPGNVTCQVVDHSGGVDFAATGTWGPNQRKDSGSHLIQFGSGVWVKVRCWSGAINFTSDKLYF